MKSYSLSKDLKDPFYEVLPLSFLPERDIHLRNFMRFWHETLNKRPKYQAGDFSRFLLFFQANILTLQHITSTL
jgi:hypothetical protein